ncbi:MAG: ribonuclease HII [Candidatus Omnitrophica bacterium 4484_49]|nr:MAG: ribonuclease HII [Candidatus Omnitrophica bacterium 4484_49]
MGKKVAIKIEKKLLRKGKKFIAGVDEVGRGALAGPVLACALIYHCQDIFQAWDLFQDEVDDSKLLSPQKRIYLFPRIKEFAWFGIGKIQSKIIDRINILEATRRAMKEAVLSLPVKPDILLIDGNVKLDLPIPQYQIIGGDRTSFVISSASILAKVIRDRIMERLHNFYSPYNFRRNKGYGTREHLESLSKYGPSPVHRLSFSPVRNAVEK